MNTTHLSITKTIFIDTPTKIWQLHVLEITDICIYCTNRHNLLNCQSELLIQSMHPQL